MKKKCLVSLLVVLTSVFTINFAGLAQTGNDAANITDLMGERPSNSYYQNPSTGTQTQGSGSVFDSAGISVLQQEATGNLKVEEPIATVTPITATKSSGWKLFAILAAIFFIVAVALFVIGIKARKSVKKIVDYELPKVKEVVTKPKKSTKKQSATKK